MPNILLYYFNYNVWNTNCKVLLEKYPQPKPKPILAFYNVFVHEG